MPNYEADKLAAAEWARDVLADGTAVILDSETTGLGSDARVCQIAIIDLEGTVLLDTLVNPQVPIPADATAIHGITDEMVKDAPDLAVTIRETSKEHGLALRPFVVYNKDYDFRVIRQHLKAISPNSGFAPLEKDCAMKQYAKFVGDWNPRYSSYKWQRLPAIPDHPPHQAVSDCFATLALIKEMASYGHSSPTFP